MTEPTDSNWKLPNLLTRFWALFGKSDEEEESKDAFEIEELIDEVDRLIAQNREGYLKTAKLQERQRIVINHKSKEIEGVGETIKRCRLREIARIKRRIGRLERILSIYNDNIDLHTTLIERLEDMLASGNSIISADQVEEFHSDYEELYESHRDMMISAKSMMSPIEYPDDDLLDDPEIKKLAEEHGLIPNT